jgi:cell division septal protein FtsQ
MKFSKKILIMVSLFMAVGLSASLLYWDSRFFTVKRVSVTLLEIDPQRNKSSLEEGAILFANKVLQQQSQKNIWKLNLEAISQAILKDPRILSVRVQRDLPSHLSAIIDVREVAILYQDKKGQIIPVTSDGVLLEAMALENAPDAPILRDMSVLRDQAKLKQIISLVSHLPEHGTVSRATISELRWSESEGLKVELMRSEAGIIVLGDENIPLRAKRAASVIKYLESQKQKWRVIDASFSKKVLVRLRKHS